VEMHVTKLHHTAMLIFASTLFKLITTGPITQWVYCLN